VLQPNSYIKKIPSCIHGGVDYNEIAGYGINPGSLMDFSVNCNPFGPPPRILETLSNTPVNQYPDSESNELKLALAEKYNLSSDELIIGSGSTELIRLVALAYFNAGQKVLIPQPTYGEYEVASHIASASVVKQLTSEEKQFRININETVKLIKKYLPRGIFLCNPNNPTGQYLKRDELEYVLRNAEDSLVLLDEAYIAFTEEIWSSIDLLKKHHNLFILRSMTKDYALAGLRLGYGIAAKPIISVLKRIKPPWNITSISQKAGKIALYEDEYLRECSVKINEAKAYLVEELTSLGYKPIPSRSNFFLVKTGNATELRHILIKKGILVRDCTSFGMPDYIRIAPLAITDCKQLIDAMKEVRLTQYVS
jgi:histidinol-phosphate aminotransferase